MKPLRAMSNKLVFVLTLVLVVSVAAPAGVTRVRAESEIPLSVNVPSIWQDTLTSDLLAAFEAQHPGVKVYVNYSNTAFFGFNASGSAIDDHLDETEETVTSADVVYVSPTTLTEMDTQAGYFLDLAPLVMNDPAMDVSDFVPGAWQSFQWDNGMWALPLSVDVILLTYDPAAFDAVGLAYPNERWTIDDFANAADLLTVYAADGTVETPGFSVFSGGDNQNIFLRALIGESLYDATTIPNAPNFSGASIEHVLQTWYEMVQDGVAGMGGGGGGQGNDVPLQVTGVNGYSGRFGGPDQQDDTVLYASLLPGGVAGLSTQGFAVSAGALYPELAYDLASYLTGLSELANNFTSAAPARYSLADSQAQSQNNNNGNGGPGVAVGGPGGFIGVGGTRSIPEEIQPVVDQGLSVALPVSELRYAEYLDTALSDMETNGTDAVSALQVAEAQAVSDSQTAQARAGTVDLTVALPDTGPVLQPGEIALTCGVNLGIGGRLGFNTELPNQTEWDQVIDAFVASDPDVGAVILESTDESDLASLAEQYDCFILPTNAVEGGDVSSVLNLDPLIDTDLSFDRNDVIGNTLAQLQQDGKTWALPLAMTPQVLEYDPSQFALAGVPEPVDGWTAEQFTDALHMLKRYDTDPTPFEPNDPSGSYLLMLIAAYGGLPLDYRTDPPTVNFTDPATVDAIRQVLDLAAEGYIAYTGVGDGVSVVIGGPDADVPAITTNSLSQFNFRPAGPGNQQQELAQTTYPQGSTYGVIAYEITTGYISANAQNPEAAYRFLSAVASSPQVFSGMPVRQSLVSDPAVIASQGEDVVAMYQQLDTLLRSPNTIVFPTFTAGRGREASNFLQEYWLRQAFDNYLSGADLETELADAELIVTAYQACVDSIAVADTGDAQQLQGERFQQMMQCATSAAPNFTFGQ